MLGLSALWFTRLLHGLPVAIQMAYLSCPCQVIVNIRIFKINQGVCNNHNLQILQILVYLNGATNYLQYKCKVYLNTTLKVKLVTLHTFWLTSLIMLVTGASVIILYHWRKYKDHTFITNILQKSVKPYHAIFLKWTSVHHSIFF